MRNSASSGVESPVEPLISPISVSRPAHAGIFELTARLASRFWSLGWCDASMAMERDARLEHGGDLDQGLREVLLVLHAVVVGVDGDGDRDAHLVAQGVDDARHVPVVHRAVGLLPALGLGDLDDDGGIGPLCRPQRATDDEGVTPVRRHRDGLALGPHRAVDDLAADDERLGVGEEGLDVGRTAHLEGSLEILCIRHGSLLQGVVGSLTGILPNLHRMEHVACADGAPAGRVAGRWAVVSPCRQQFALAKDAGCWRHPAAGARDTRRTDMDAGTRAIEWLFTEQLKVDRHWAVRSPDGFRWWADKQAQSIEIVGRQEGGPSGAVGYLIRVRTDVLRDVVLDDDKLSVIDSEMMSFSSMAGLAYDEEARTPLAQLPRQGLGRERVLGEPVPRHGGRAPDRRSAGGGASAGDATRRRGRDQRAPRSRPAGAARRDGGRHGQARRPDRQGALGLGGRAVRGGRQGVPRAPLAAAPTATGSSRRSPSATCPRAARSSRELVTRSTAPACSSCSSFP